MKVMVVVTHLLGTGHLARALTLAQAYHAAGDAVTVVSGGMPAPHLKPGPVTLVQLPPVRSDGVDFTRLLTPDGPADAAFLAQRQTQVLEAFDTAAPDVLITELFPFGRRVLRAEFRALLDHARTVDHPPLICASIRDILAPPSKPRKAAFAEDTVAACYDAVLVHSDPALTPLELSWPVSDSLRRALHYTGFVAPPPAMPSGDAAGEVIVSAGGGDVGGHVYAAALNAARLDAGRAWRLLVGGGNADRLAQLRAEAPSNAAVEPARPDFRALLHRAAASVSLCGYNTALDVLQAGVPAVFVPFDEGAEVEQGLRATALAAQPGIAQLTRAALTPQTLLAALAEVTTAPRRPARGLFDGAARTVEITREMRKTR